MTWVKICGMTNLEDALTAVEAGADAVGFVFYEKSPRNITVEAAREIVEKLPESVEKIGVFVNGDSVEPWKIVLEAGLTGWQTYATAPGGTLGSQNTGVDLNLLPKLTRFLPSLPMNLLVRAKNRFEVWLLASRLGQSRQRVSICWETDEHDCAGFRRPA